MKLFKISLLCLALLLPLGTLNAQDKSTIPPLVFTSSGDLWRYDLEDGTAEKFTDWGYNNMPVLNEKTGLVAYNSLAQVWVDAIEAGEGMSGSMASNIWVIEPLTQKAFRPADQPADASISGGNFVLRTDPTWSPDGLKLAWGEYTLRGDSESYSISIFDVTTSESEVFALPETSYYGVPGPVPVLWSPDGAFLALKYMQWDETASTAANVLDFYDPTTMTLVTHVEYSEQFHLDNWLWLTHLGTTHLGIYLAEGVWAIVNPDTGEMLFHDGAVYGSVQNAPEESLRLVFQADTWAIEFPTATTQPLAYAPSVYLFNNIALDPTGRYVAFADESAKVLVILDGGVEVERLTVEDIIQGISWSNLIWETDGTETVSSQG